MLNAIEITMIDNTSNDEIVLRILINMLHRSLLLIFIYFIIRNEIVKLLYALILNILKLLFSCVKIMMIDLFGEVITIGKNTKEDKEKY